MWLAVKAAINAVTPRIPSFVDFTGMQINTRSEVSKQLSDQVKVFFWFFGGLFLYILSNNLLGLLPNATSPSINISNNVALALSTLIFFTVVGFQRQGMGFIWHLFGPKLPWWLIPVTLLIFVIETLGTFIIRPASLSLRLTGNMNGDHTILGFAYSAVPYFLPLLAYGLGLFVSLIQSFVFTLLSIIYVLLSLEHDDHH